MDKSDIQNFEDARRELDELKARLAALEEHLGELEAAAAALEAEYEEPIDISLDDDSFDAAPQAESSSAAPEEEGERGGSTASEPAAPSPAPTAPQAENSLATPKEEGERGGSAVSSPAAAAPQPKVQKTVADVAAPKGYSWQADRPGAPVSNVLSAIGLNDRLLFINTLFKEDPVLFRATVDAFNAMSSFVEAEAYVAAQFPDWNLASEPVYRLMMAVRRKLDA